jgi:hypothetical protein
VTAFADGQSTVNRESPQGMIAKHPRSFAADNQRPEGLADACHADG